MFHVFGDESSYKSTVVYGVIALSDSSIPVTNNAIQSLKTRFGVAISAEFHSRIVFHGDQRRRSQWSILNEAQMLDFAEAFITLLIDQNAIFSVGAVHRDEYPSAFPPGGGFPSGVMKTKQRTAIVFQAAVNPIIKRLGPNNLQLWVDPDSTKILWFGKKMRADRHYKALIPGSGSDNLIEPQKAGANPPVLLEAADLFAYVCAHALAPDDCRQKERFEVFYQLYRPLLSVLTYDPEKRIKNQVPTSILEVRHSHICGDGPDSKGAFHNLPVGACIWMQGRDRSGQSYPCVLMKVPKGQAQKVMNSKNVDIRAAVRVVGTIPVPCVLFLFRDDLTIYTTFPNHKLTPDSSPLTQLGQGKELRLVLFEDNPAPIGEISFQHTEVQFWNGLVAEIDKFPMCTESEFWSAVSTLGLSTQELWDSI